MSNEYDIILVRIWGWNDHKLIFCTLYCCKTLLVKSSTRSSFVIRTYEGQIPDPERDSAKSTLDKRKGSVCNVMLIWGITINRHRDIQRLLKSAVDSEAPLWGGCTYRVCLRLSNPKSRLKSNPATRALNTGASAGMLMIFLQDLRWLQLLWPRIWMTLVNMRRRPWLKPSDTQGDSFQSPAQVQLR